MDWQPIETAPKDGTIMLLYPLNTSDKRSNNGIGMGYWYRPHPDAKSQKGMWITHFSVGSRRITHWMPLPAPPGAS